MTFAQYDHQVVLGVLRFIYAAELVVPPSDVKDTRHLAAKYVTLLQVFSRAAD